MPFLSLKEVLAGCLEAALFSVCEDNPIHFMVSLHKNSPQKLLSRKIALSNPIHWRNIPIEKKQTTGSVLYTSALPHIVARTAIDLESATLSDISKQLVNQLNQDQFQTLNSDLDHGNDLLSFVRQLWSEFKIETRRPGWLALHLSNRGIDLWIQHHQKVFQTNHKHTQLFLHYGCLSQMSYSLFKSVDQADRDHNDSAFNPSNQHRNQKRITPVFGDLSKQTTLTSSTSEHEFPRPQPSDHALSQQIVETQLIPAEPTSHRQAAGQRLPEQTALRPKQKPLAENWLWQVQYTYARCCAVIQRWESITAEASIGPSLPKGSGPEALTAQSSKLAVSIGTSPKEASQPLTPDSPLTPNSPHPRHNQSGSERQARDRKTDQQPTNQRQAQKVIDQQLIASLIELADNLFWIPYRWPSQQYFLLLKSTSVLCQAFEAFSSHCLVGLGQVLGSQAPRDRLKIITSEQLHFQTRVELVIATKNILKVLLEVYLDAPAPTEL